tara:strand:- start:325 stop:891 length:567 start_codon:yes stop_codon:yes gene_type:complete
VNPKDVVDGKLQAGAVVFVKPEIKYVRMPKAVKVKMLFLTLTGEKQIHLMSDVVDSSIIRGSHLLEASRLFFHYLTSEKQISIMSKMLHVEDFRMPPLRQMCQKLGLPSIGSKEAIVSNVCKHFDLVPDSSRNSRSRSPRRSSSTRHRTRSCSPYRKGTLDYPSERDLGWGRSQPDSRVKFGKRKGGK